MRHCFFILFVTLGLPLCAWQEPAQNKPPEQTNDQPTAEPSAVDDVANQAVPDYEPPERKDPNNLAPDMGKSVMRMIQGLLLVLALIIGLGWVARKVLPHQLGLGPGTGQMRLLQSLPLGPKRFVALLEIDERRFLLGVTDHKVSLLASLDPATFAQTLDEVPVPKTVSELLEEEP